MISKDTIGAIRFGYGPAGKGGKTAAALYESLPGGNAIARRYPMHAIADVLDLNRRIRERRQQTADGMGGPATVRQLGEQLIAMAEQGLQTNFARILESESPLFERLTWFWADHFTVSLGRGGWRSAGTAFIDEAIRPAVAGRFADMLWAAVTHPGMLNYLSQNSSVGPKSRFGMQRKRGLNENLAREILELHTLGVGADYTQADVRQLAELLTGLTYDLKSGFLFRPEIAEPGPERVLGKLYGNGTAQLRFVMEALEDLAAHPATARHIARKLAVHFVADTPDADLVASLEAAYLRSGGRLLAVYEALLSHPAAWRPPGGKARQPLDYVGALLIAVGATGDEMRALDGRGHNRLLWHPLRTMGQTFLEAPGPNGWPEEATHWITPQGLAHRIAYARLLARRPVARDDDPRAFLDRALADAAGEPLRFAVDAAKRKQDAFALILASTEMNRR